MRLYLGFGLVAAFLLGAVFVVRPPEVAQASGLGGPGLANGGVSLAAANTWTGAQTFGGITVGGFANFQGSAQIAGNFLLNAVSGTAGSGTGITANSTAQLGHYVHKITVAETALTAAATTQDITIWTVPAKTRLLRIVVSDVTGFTGGGLTAMTVMCGPSGGSAVYLVAGSVFASNAVLGDVAAEIGSSLTAATVADIPSMTATQAIVCRFTSTTANVVAATAGTASFYIEAVTYP